MPHQGLSLGTATFPLLLGTEEIIKFAKGGDLIILGHNDRSSGINKVLDKSVVKEVVKNAPCSVLVVKT